jgi:hypothetical protein
MHNVGFSSRSRVQSAFLENFHHRSVLRQDFGDQFLEPGIPGDCGKMTHQCGADPLSLVFVDQGESHLSTTRLKDDVASTPHDDRSSAFLSDGDQGYMADKVDVREEFHFLFGKMASYRKETTAEGLSAGAADGLFKAVPILVPERADFNAASIAQCLNR